MQQGRTFRKQNIFLLPEIQKQLIPDRLLYG